jgi:hypothetical protein
MYHQGINSRTLVVILHKTLKYKIVDELLSFDWLNFKNAEDQTVMMAVFSGRSLKPGRTKLLTKLDNNDNFNVGKSSSRNANGL